MRHRAHLSQEAVARAAQMDPSLLREIERGDVKGVRLSTIFYLALALGVEPKELAEEAGI